MALNNTFTKVDFNQYKDAYDMDIIHAWKGREMELDVETLRALMYGFTFTKDYAEGNLEDSFFMDFWRDNSLDIKISGVIFPVFANWTNSRPRKKGIPSLCQSVWWIRNADRTLNKS